MLFRLIAKGWALDEVVRELDQNFKIGTTYSSNALEGNSLTLSETKVLLEDGITALQAAQRDENPTDSPFQKIIAECGLGAQRDYCRMFRIPLQDRAAHAPER